jgi:hypothetical protein
VRVARLAVLVVLVVTGPLGVASSAAGPTQPSPPSPGCPYVTSFWRVVTTQLKVTRVGTFESPGATLSMTETDVGLPVKETLLAAPVSADTDCSFGQLSAFVENLPLSSTLAGQWSEPSTTTSMPRSTGTCSGRERWPVHGHGGLELRATEHGNPRGTTSNFNPRASNATFQLLVDLPLGLTCSLPGGQGSLDWPIPHTVPLISELLRVRTHSLHKDLRFTVAPRATLRHRERWLTGPSNGTETITLTLSGRLTLVPLGCQTLTSSTHLQHSC